MGSKVSSIWELSPVLDVQNVMCVFCSGVGYFWYYVRRVNYLLRATITQRTVPLQYQLRLLCMFCQLAHHILQRCVLCSRTIW
jgi:hypothetical protein